jgi:predicted Zn-dependent peptidase
MITQIKVILFSIFILQGLLMSATLKQIPYNDKKIATIFEKHKSLPIFNLQLVFTNGGYIGDDKLPGITNLVAQLLNEGTKKDGAVGFARKLENNAISIHTNTGFETFVIEISCLTSEKELALELLKDLLKDPNFAQESLEKVKTLTLSKLQQKQNDFDYIASSNLKKLTYKNTPLEHPKLGTQESIKKITLEDIQTRQKEIFNLDNLIIAVGGDIKFKEFQAQASDFLEYFDTNGVTNTPKITMSDKVQYEEIIKDTKQSYIYFMSPFYLDVDSKENYKAKVASFILGGSGFGSRMMEEIRVKHGLAYSAYGYIKNQKTHSYFTGYLQTKLDNTTKAKKMVEKIIEEFVQNGVTKEELEAAKKFLSGSEPLRTETFSQRLNRSFHLYYKNLPLDYPQKELEMIQNLSVEELNRFIRSHQELKNLTFSIVTQNEKE